MRLRCGCCGERSDIGAAPSGGAGPDGVRCAGAQPLPTIPDRQPHELRTVPLAHLPFAKPDRLVAASPYSTRRQAPQPAAAACRPAGCMSLIALGGLRSRWSALLALPLKAPLPPAGSGSKKSKDKGAAGHEPTVRYAHVTRQCFQPGLLVSRGLESLGWGLPPGASEPA